MKFDATVRYAESHEWARPEKELFIVGISDYAQDSLGDVVFVELPAVGKALAKGEAFGVVESVKAASDLYMPIGGKIAAVNAALKDAPALLNSDPFGQGWLVKIEPSDPAEYKALMDAAAYQKTVQGAK
jgi:glycine cleavage system H protein